jgi:hypothetical protein
VLSNLITSPKDDFISKKEVLKFCMNVSTILGNENKIENLNHIIDEIYNIETISNDIFDESHFGKFNQSTKSFIEHEIDEISIKKGANFPKPNGLIYLDDSFGKPVSEIDFDENEFLTSSELNIFSKSEKKESSIKRNTFISKCIEFKDFKNGFGLFSVFSNFIKNINKVDKWDMSEIKYKFGKPSIKGFLNVNDIDNIFITVECGVMVMNDSVFSLDELIIENVDLCENRIVLTMNEKNYNFKFNENEFKSWIWVIQMNTGLKKYQNQSFARAWNHCGCEFFHCGESYFSDLAGELKRAKSQIFICGWQITPQLFLKVFSIL